MGASSSALDLYAQQAKVLEGIRTACVAYPEITEEEMGSAAWAIVNHVFGWRQFRFWSAEDPRGHKGWAMSLYAKWLEGSGTSAPEESVAA